MKVNGMLLIVVKALTNLIWKTQVSSMVGVKICEKISILLFGWTKPVSSNLRWVNWLLDSFYQVTSTVGIYWSRQRLLASSSLWVATVLKLILEQIVTLCVCRWVSGWEPCLTTWNTSHATSSPLTLMPSWYQPTRQPWTRLINWCRGIMEIALFRSETLI